MISALTRLPGSSFELTLTFPWPEVKKIYDVVFAEVAAEIEVEGFRKGKAPENLIAQKVDKSKVYGEVVNRLLPEAYSKALDEYKLKPIISPKIQIVSGEEGKDWQFKAVAAERPQVVLDNYREMVKGINAKGKIWTPGSTQDLNPQEDEKKKAEDQSRKISEIVQKLLEICKVELPELLAESETNKLVTQLVDDVRQAGLTFEQYLQSSGQTAEQLQQKYRQQAEAALKMEFILEAIADDLDIRITQQDVESVINKETDPEKKKALTAQSYLLASILRREQTLTKLANL